VRWPSRRTLAAAGATLAVLGCAARFVPAQPLWLDEALSVNIARLPYAELTEALRHDGSPPFYYLLLGLWLRVFGDGPIAARSLSAVFGVLTVPAAWAFARAVSGSRRVAWTAALLLATSPFAIRYGSEARMYALVQLLVALGGWALVRLLRQPRSYSAFAGVAACTGLLLLTHYWSLYLLGAVGLALLWRRAWRGVAALAVGGVLFLPWLPSFLYQLAHTGTPWAPRPALVALVDAVLEWAGVGPFGRFLFVLLFFLALLGLFGAGVDARRVELDLRGRPLGRRLAAVVFGTLLLGVAAGMALKSGYAPRYSAVVVVPFLVLAATGAAALLDDRVRVAIVGLAAVLGLVIGVPAALKQRTQAGVVAAALRGQVGPRDVVVYCPDQLGPAVSRLLPRDTPQVVFPSGGRPELVDWVDYAERNEAGDPVAFADDLVRRHPDGSVWLVVAGGYRTYEDRCEELAERLRAVRAEDPLVRSRGRYGERSALVRFTP
jgi:hypothetical protein